ncbi:MAG: ribosome small subunit-dependent GTPase A [Cardiobacteriales bacterium]|nr:MAG: ribosome small subunit-dependent GTPase A [Cardiobacteriales bacterium]
MTKKLSKQQQRRIQANQLGKLCDYSDDEVALVITHLGFEVLLSHKGQFIAADWRKQTGSIACNDRVLISKIGNDRAIIEAIFPHEKTLYKWSGRKLKPLVSHIDQLLIVIAVKPEWQSNLLDRYLIAAQASDIDVAILCNKLDLADKAITQDIHQRLQPYADLGYPLFYSSLENNIGISELSAWLAGKQTVICGQSGVGKSSLISHLIPDLNIWTQAISAATELGRHTTTNLRRYPYHPSAHQEGAIIDTPGVRGFAIPHLSREQIISGFKDISPYTTQCKFNDCSHRHEPQCAVLAALNAKTIYPQRYDSMMQLLDEYHF